MDDFVTFEIAKKLKEKGFSWICSHYYRTKSKDLFMIYPCEDWSNIEERVNAPTISQVLKWLREEREVDLVIEPIFCYDENKHREYGVRVFAPSLNKPVQCGYFNKWEKASIAGIEYVLDKLI